MSSKENYKISEEISTRSVFSVYRAMSESGDREVILKLPKTPAAMPENIAMIQNEYAILSKLNHKGIRNAVAQIQYQEKPCLVLEYKEGVTLSSARFQELNLNEKVEAFIQLCDTFAYLSENNILHLDLNPSNVLYNSELKETYVIDFGSAVAMAADKPWIEAPKYVHLHYGYVSPEMTGRLDSLIDIRSDMYSLGLVFYRAITGADPFQSEDNSRLVYSQIAQEPKPISEIIPNISPVMVEVINKMIKKAPEGRYQSWKGLRDDLIICKNLLQEDAGSGNFIAGTTDKTAGLIRPSVIVGRDAALAALYQEFLNASNGSFSLCLIHGLQGSGKSYLAQNLFKTINEKSLMVAFGTSHGQKGKPPFSPFTEALNQLITSLLLLGEDDLNQIRQRIEVAIEGNLALITNLIPAAKLLLGEHPIPETLPLRESANRMNHTLVSFIQALPSPQIPIILFFDDLHFSDSSSLSLLEELASSAENSHLMIVGSYDDSKIKESPAFESFIDKQSLGKLSSISLALDNLTQDDVEKYIQLFYTNYKEEKSELVNFLYSKSRGNPALLAELAQLYYNAELIRFNQVKNQWQYDIKKLETMPISTSFAEVIIQRADDISIAEKALLGVAACIGSIFDLQTLAHLTGKSIIDLPALLNNAIKCGIIQPVDQTYFIISNVQDSGLSFPDCYLKFTHVEIKNLLEGALSDAEKVHTHWKIGEYIAQNKSLQNTETTFEIANHFNHALSEAIDAAQVSTLIRANNNAAVSAKNISSWVVSMDYYKIVFDVLENKNCALEKSEKFELWLDIAEIAYLSNEKELAIATLKKLDDIASSNIERARVETIWLGYYLNIGDFHKAKEVGFLALKHLGISPPNKLLRLSVLFRILAVWMQTRNKGAKFYLGLPEMTEKEDLMSGPIIWNLLPILYNEKFELLVDVTLKFFQLTIKKGNSPFILGYNLWGTLLAMLFKKYEKGWEVSLVADEIVEGFNSPYYSAYSKYGLGWNSPFTNHVAQSFPYFDQAVRLALKSGGFLTVANVGITRAPYALFAGLPLEIQLKNLHKNRSYTKSFGYSYATLYNDLFIGYLEVFSSSSLPEKTGNIFAEIDAELKKSTYRLNWALASLFNAVVNLHLGDLNNAVYHIQEAEKNQSAIVGPITEQLYRFNASIILLLSAEHKQYRKKVKKHLAVIKQFAVGSPENNNHLIYLIEALLARNEGDKFKSIELFRKGINHAREYRFLQEAALGSELFADYLKSLNLIQFSQTEYLNAAQLYFEWGSPWKQQQMAEKSGAVTNSIGLHSVSHSTTGADIDLLTTVNISQAISVEVQLESLSKKLLELLIENAGAQFASIYLNKNNSFVPYNYGLLDEGQIKIEFNSESDAEYKTPMSIIRYVSRSAETLVLEDASESQFLSHSDKQQGRKILSVFCHPVISKGKTIAIIYLENNSLKGAFSKERIEFLKLISGQISISLENSMLYENLEQKVEERTLEITKKKEELEIQKAAVEIQKKKSDDLLLNILPEDVAEELKQTGKAAARLHPEATVMFMDIISFTNHAETIPPDKLVAALDDFFGRIDKIIWDAGIEKIKTIGDAYLCASGLPIPDENHAEKMIKAALKIIESQKEFNNDRIQAGEQPFQFRIGIHSGPVVSGVVGTRKFAYDIWGDTVNTSARMESQSQEGKINISGTTYGLIKDKFHCTSRGALEAKNKGLIPMYFVEGEK